MITKSVLVLRQRNYLSICHKKYSSNRAINVEKKKQSSSDSSESLQREWEQAQPYKSLPGPTKFEMFRGFLPGGDFYGKPFDELMRLCRQRYGDIYLLPGLFGMSTNLVTFNLEDHEKVFRTEGPQPMRPGMEAVEFYRLSRKNSIYNEDYLGVSGNGQQWAKFRQMVNPIVMQPKSMPLYIAPLQKVNMKFIQRIRELRDPETLEVPSNFLTQINSFSLESLAHIALDKEMGLLDDHSKSPEAKEMFKHLFSFGDAFYDLGVQPTIYKYIKTPAYKRFEKSMDVVYEICTKYVMEAVQRLEQNGSAERAENSILEKLLKIDRKMAIITAIDLLMGGVEITSTVMSAVFLCMAKNPEKQEKLRLEILSNVGRNSQFTLENMKNLPYLRACIKEALRIYPVVFGNIRITGRALCLSGYQVPQKTNVFMASNMLLHDEKYFPKPSEYIPERWLRSGCDGMDELSVKNNNPFIFLPFGFGPRSCLGKRIVDIELEMTLANIVRNFYMEYNYSTDNAFRTYFMNTCIIPLKFKFTDLN
ncbi:putative cytochrome P450 12c1, mitochondrial [Haematobia irritans]|uniref:putative cytochrome P450 12c1, mitochondrial n=1 Tax=Haematobia irritans TaxID=7368 RepID=UPI003F4F9D1D